MPEFSGPGAGLQPGGSERAAQRAAARHVARHRLEMATPLMEKDNAMRYQKTAVVRMGLVKSAEEAWQLFNQNFPPLREGLETFRLDVE